MCATHDPNNASHSNLQRNAIMTAHPPPLSFLLVLLTFVVAEIVWRRRRVGSYDFAALGGSFGVAIGQGITNAPGALLIGAVFAGAAALSPLAWPMEDWRTWAACFLAVEFAYYWQHRMLHQVRWFWASHAVHHSANEMVLPAAMRLGWATWLTGAFLPLTVPVLLGFPPLMVATLTIINLRYQFFLHTEAVGRLGPLEWVFNTPAHHRAHHGAEPQYRDCNFGGVLIVFDRLFGTLGTQPDAEPARYGRAEPLLATNPLAIALHEWHALVRDVRRTDSFGAALRLLFVPTAAGASVGVRPSGVRPSDSHATKIGPTDTHPTGAPVPTMTGA